MNKKLDFESALKELEQITTRLESGELSLEESIELFEKGIKLSGDCRAVLERAKLKILSLTDSAEEQNENV